MQFVDVGQRCCREKLPQHGTHQLNLRLPLISVHPHPAYIANLKLRLEELVLQQGAIRVLPAQT